MRTCPKEDLCSSLIKNTEWGKVNKTSIKKRMKEHTMVYPNNRVGHSEKKGQTTDKPV